MGNTAKKIKSNRRVRPSAPVYFVNPDNGEVIEFDFNTVYFKKG